jgi:type IV pilus assembly protein PilO
MKFGPRDVMFLIVLLAFPIASWWTLFRPQNAEIAQALQEIEFKQETLAKVDAATARAKDLEQENEAIREGIELMEQRLPSGKEVEAVLDDVASLAQSHGLELPKFVTEKPVQSAGFGEQPLEVRVVGAWESFYLFLQDIERLERITKISNMELTRAKKAEGAKIEAVLELNIYFSDAQEETG